MLFSPNTRKDFQILLFYSKVLVILDILINRIYYSVNFLRPQPRKICGWYHESTHTQKNHIPFIFKDAEARKYRPPLTSSWSFPVWFKFHQSLDPFDPESEERHLWKATKQEASILVIHIIVIVLYFEVSNCSNSFQIY